jgi:tetratricopeptide (TPR) repeat protein
LTNSLTALLQGHVDRPGVRPVLEAAFVSDDPWVMRPAARGLGRTESDRVVGVTRELLTAGDATACADASALLEDMDSRLPELAESLLEAIESGVVHHDTLAALAGHLLRAGHPHPPTVLVEAVNDRRQYEHATDKPPEEVCTVARRWLAKLLCERVAELRARDDRAAPLWLPDYAPEPHAAGWGHFFAVTWSELDSAGLLPFFVSALAGHAGDEERWQSDRLMMPAVLAACVAGDGHLALAVPLGQAMAREGSAIAQRDARYAERVLQVEVANQAKVLADAGALKAARSAVDSLRQAEVLSGSVLATDAYLVWKEESAEAALTRVDAALLAVGSIHRPTPDSERAVLLNTAGYILSHEGRWAEALPWFMEAAKADHTQVFHLDNIAETLHELGRADDAVTWANKARAAGSRAEVVAAILGRA